MTDTRLRRIAAFLDDARTQITDIEDESPPRYLARHLQAAHDALNTAIQHIGEASAGCPVCGGAGIVLCAEPEGEGFRWAGERIACPSCDVRTRLMQWSAP